MHLGWVRIPVHLSWSFILLWLGTAYPSYFWHFNSLSAPGPGLTLYNATITPAGTLVMDGRGYGQVDSSIDISGFITVVFRFFPTFTPLNSRIIDFGTGPTQNSIILTIADGAVGALTSIGQQPLASKAAGGMWKMNQWNTVCVQFSYNNFFATDGVAFFGETGLMTALPAVRTRQYIGSALYYDNVTWRGELDFVWVIGRQTGGLEMQMLAVQDGDFMANAWTFQTPSDSPSVVSLTGNPSLNGGVLNLKANHSQGALVNQSHVFGGAMTIAARVIMYSYQPWSRIIDFSDSGTNNIIISALGTTDTASVAIYRGTQVLTIACPAFWQLGVWYTVLLRINGTEFLLYRDDALLCFTQTGGWEPYTVTRNQQWIGKSSDSTDAGLDGSIQYVMHWPRAISGIEIAYFISSSRAPSFLVGAFFNTIDSPLILHGSPLLSGGKVYLNGSSWQYIQIDSIAAISTPFSISTIFTADVPRFNVRIFEFGNGIKQDNVIMYQDNTSSSVVFQVTVGANTQALRCANFFTNYGYAMAVVVVHDGYTVSIYQNNNLLCTGSMLSVPLLTRTKQYIGKSIDETDQNWQGQFDYFLYYDKALSLADALCQPNGIDRWLIYCPPAPISDPRVNMGTCVSNGRQGATCQLACNSPYVGLNSNPGVCTTIPGAEAAAWSSQSITCVVQCPVLTAPQNGSMTCNGPYGSVYENSACLFACAVGFSMVGSNSATCATTGGGSWTNPAPSCTAVNCSVPVLQYGTVNCVGPFGPTKYLSSCSFSCPDGFSRNGVSNATCLAPGQWSSTIPSCVPVACPVLSLAHGNITCQIPYGGSWTYGSVCTFACGSNYTMTGARQTSCLATTQWNASTPVCNLVLCSNLSAPTNGTLSCDRGAFNVSSSVTSKCTYSCMAGYQLTNAASLTCQNTGDWSVAAPTCVDINECLVSTACPYGATCTNLPGNYTCSPVCTTLALSTTTGTPVLRSPLGDNVRFAVYLGYGVNLNFSSITYTLLTSGNAIPSVCNNVTTTPAADFVVNITCKIGPGLGARFNLSLPYSRPGGPSLVLKTSAFQYPTPTINSGSLAIYNTTPAAKVIAQNYEQGDIISFTGTGYLADSTLLSVTYAPVSSSLQSACTLILALCNQTTITCRTQPYGSGLDLVFTVNANGVLITGQDTYSIFNVPNVLSLTADSSTGCISSGSLLYGCPTTGNVQIVIVANYISTTNLNGFISGLICTYIPPLVANGTDNIFFACLLPPGTGFNRTVVVTSDGKYSQPQNLLSYASPTIFSISGCTQVDSLTVTNCDREGGDLLVVLGLNFGADSSSVSVGGQWCSSTTHDAITPHARVVCVMPPGFSLARQVQLFQAAGPFTQTRATVDYTQCGPGTFQQASDITCGLCLPGTYSSVSGALTCLRCDPGRYSSQNTSATCSLCDAGSVQPLGGMASCTYCDPGYYTSVKGAVSCVPCNPGTNTSQPGSTGCASCAPGTVAPRLGMDICTPCGGGYAAGNQQSQCQLCPAGTFSLSGSSACESCNEGYFQPVAGTTFCNACSPGSYSPTIGRADCLPCDSGYASNQTAATSCSMCLPGSVSKRNSTSTVGPVQCDLCAPGAYISTGGQAVCITCSPGTSANSSGSTTCDLCLAGYHQSSPGAGQCDPCPLGSYTALSGRPECSLCGSGTRSNMTAATYCVACDAGTYSTAATSVGVSVCTPCTFGTYVNTIGQVACLLCPVGSFAPNVGAQSCSPCPPGMAAPSGGARTCASCIPGQYTGVSGQERCNNCPTGKYSPMYNASTCFDCSEGYYQAAAGSSSCDPCQSGQFTSVPAQSTCSSCAAGKSTDTSNSIICVDCTAGSYQTVPGSSHCDLCPAGQYTDGNGRDVCILCSSGKFNVNSNSSTCDDCPFGTFQGSSTSTHCDLCPTGYSNPSTGQSVCVACDPGTFANSSGMKSCRRCPSGSYQLYPTQTDCTLCAPGTFSSEGSSTCLACPAGLVAMFLGSTTCSKCTDNSVPDQSQSGCNCVAGHYMKNKTCYPCPVGTVCAPGTTRSTIATQDGYFLSDNESLTYQKCLSPKSCVAGNCVSHRAGLLCSQCQPGYSLSEWTKECTPCKTRSHSAVSLVFTLLGLLLAVFVLYAYVIRSALVAYGAKAAEKDASESLKGRAGILRQSSNNAIMNNLARLSRTTLDESGKRGGSVDGGGPAATRVTNNADRSAEFQLVNTLLRQDRKHRSDSTYILKIVVNFFQVASSLIGLPVAGAIAFPTYYMTFLSYFKFFNIDFIPWQNVSCLFPTNFYNKLVVITIVPAGLIIALATVVFLATVIMDCRDWSDEDAGRLRRQKMRYVFVRGAIFTAFMLYPMISSTVLSHFSCITVGRQTLLIADFNVTCHGELWKRWTPYVVVMTFIYPVGIPFLFISLLYKYRDDLQSPFASLGLGFLHESYIPRVWWFEVLVMVEKLTLTSLLQFLPLNLQLGGGVIVASAFLITLVLLQPEIRLRNWQLHMLANVEIVMLLLIWHFSYSENITSVPVAIDACVSALFIVLTVVMVILLFLDLLRWTKTAFFSLVRRQRQSEEAPPLKVERSQSTSNMASTV